MFEHSSRRWQSRVISDLRRCFNKGVQYPSPLCGLVRYTIYLHILAKRYRMSDQGFDSKLMSEAKRGHVYLYVTTKHDPNYPQIFILYPSLCSVHRSVKKILIFGQFFPNYSWKIVIFHDTVAKFAHAYIANSLLCALGHLMISESQFGLYNNRVLITFF